MELLKRVFLIDVLKCSHCSSEMAFVCSIFSKEIIYKLLDHLKIKRRVIDLPDNRGPPSESLELEYDYSIDSFGF